MTKPQLTVRKMLDVKTSLRAVTSFMPHAVLSFRHPLAIHAPKAPTARSSCILLKIKLNLDTNRPQHHSRSTPTTRPTTSAHRPHSLQNPRTHQPPIPRTPSSEDHKRDHLPICPSPSAKDETKHPTSLRRIASNDPGLFQRTRNRHHHKSPPF